MQNKYIQMLGLTRRAGMLCTGHDQVCEAIRRRKTKLILFSGDASDRLVREISGRVQRACPETACIRLSETMDELDFMLGCRAAVISVNNSNFADRLTQLIEEGNAYGNKN